MYKISFLCRIQPLKKSKKLISKKEKCFDLIEVWLLSVETRIAKIKIMNFEFQFMKISSKKENQ